VRRSTDRSLHPRRYLPRDHPDFFDAEAFLKNRPKKSAEKIAAAARAKERGMRFKKQGEDFREHCRKNPIVKTLAEECKAKGGPIMVIVKAYEERRVVTTKHKLGIRGHAFAYVKAFDKYMNMLLQDVREIYTVRLKHRVEYVDKNGKTRYKIKHRLEGRERTMDQVFLRGEQIVTVALMDFDHPDCPVKVRSIHWFPYDPVAVVNAIP
jgi:small nuclear ribonucleoprotein (snRNP)-like protein